MSAHSYSPRSFRARTRPAAFPHRPSLSRPLRQTTCTQTSRSSWMRLSRPKPASPQRKSRSALFSKLRSRSHPRSPPNLLRLSTTTSPARPDKLCHRLRAASTPEPNSRRRLYTSKARFHRSTRLRSTANGQTATSRSRHSISWSSTSGRPRPICRPCQSSRSCLVRPSRTTLPSRSRSISRSSPRRRAVRSTR